MASVGPEALSRLCLCPRAWAPLCPLNPGPVTTQPWPGTETSDEDSGDTGAAPWVGGGGEEMAPATLECLGNCSGAVTRCPLPQR